MKLAAVSLLLLLAGCIAVPIPHAYPVSPLITGVVRDAQTNAPIAGAEIRVDGKTPGRSATATVLSQSDGTFRALATTRSTWWVLFAGPADSSCTATATATLNGYTQMQRTFRRAGGGSASGPCSGWKAQWDVALVVGASNNRLEPAAP